MNHLQDIDVTIAGIRSAMASGVDPLDLVAETVEPYGSTRSYYPTVSCYSMCSDPSSCGGCDGK